MQHSDWRRSFWWYSITLCADRLTAATALTPIVMEATGTLLSPPRPCGRPVKYPRREIANAILYVLYALRTGSDRRLLPYDLPPYCIVFRYYRIWRKAGVWQQVNIALRQQLRQSAGRPPKPGVAIIDSQSIDENYRKRGCAVLRYCRGVG